jgi:hypothetical protein
LDVYLPRARKRALSWIVAAALVPPPLFAHATSIALPYPDLPEAPKATYANLQPSIEPEQINLERKAKYHWKGLLAQSLEFNLMENGFRLATDGTMRFQLAHKPFWHEYVAFIKQYNMGRWNDGESFLVNYVGHPLQGSVGAYIEVQNSESQARLQ